MFEDADTPRAVSEDKTPGHFFVPVHCIPDALRLVDARGDTVAYGAPACLIEKTPWFRAKFRNNGDLPPWYEPGGVEGCLVLAMRTLPGMKGDDILDLQDNSREPYFLHPNPALTLKRKFNRFLPAMQTNPALWVDITSISIERFICAPKPPPRTKAKIQQVPASHADESGPVGRYYEHIDRAFYLCAQQRVWVGTC